MTWLEVLEYYEGLLITQYRNKTKAKDTVKLLCNSSVCDGLPLQILNSFKLNDAAGAQLTVLGKIVGVSRNIIGLDLEHTFFNFTRYDSRTSVGFSRYATQPDTNLFLRYVQDASYTLSDFELRTVIKLRILYNTRFMTFKNIKDGLYNYFQGGIDIVPPASVMEVDYEVDAIYHNAFESALYLNVVPASMGCTINTTYV